MAEPMQQMDLGERVLTGSIKGLAGCAACILEHALGAEPSSLHNGQGSVAPATYRALEGVANAVWPATSKGALDAED